MCIFPENRNPRESKRAEAFHANKHRLTASKRQAMPLFFTIQTLVLQALVRPLF